MFFGSVERYPIGVVVYLLGSSYEELNVSPEKHDLEVRLFAQSDKQVYGLLE